MTLSLKEEDNESFTVRISSIGVTVELSCGHDGRIQERVVLEGDEELFRSNFTYGIENEIRITFTAREQDEESISYRAAVLDQENADERLAVKLDDAVVFDMPLRVSAHYRTLLSEIDKEESKERVRLLRHLALATLSERIRPYRSRRYGHNTLGELDRSLRSQNVVPTRADNILFAAAGYTSENTARKLDSSTEMRRYLADCRELVNLPRGGHEASYSLKRAPSFLPRRTPDPIMVIPRKIMAQEPSEAASWSPFPREVNRE
jgi:hypothetical protein